MRGRQEKHHWLNGLNLMFRPVISSGSLLNDPLASTNHKAHTKFAMTPTEIDMYHPLKYTGKYLLDSVPH